MGILESIWEILLLFLWGFIFVSALFAVVAVVTDLVRDRSLNGWAKAAWVLFLVLVPVLAALVYLIARGNGMTDRINDRAREARDATDSYIREVAGSSPTDEIAKGKQLLDQGAITEAEYAALKSRVLSGRSA